MSTVVLTDLQDTFVSPEDVIIDNKNLDDFTGRHRSRRHTDTVRRHDLRPPRVHDCVHRLQDPDVVTLASVVKHDSADTQEGTKQLHKNPCIFFL